METLTEGPSDLVNEVGQKVIKETQCDEHLGNIRMHIRENNNVAM